MGLLFKETPLSAVVKEIIKFFIGEYPSHLLVPADNQDTLHNGR